MEYVEIAGRALSRHRDGMTLVDSFYIPDANVVQYRRDRERCADLAAAIMGQHCASVTREFQCSEDGEALVGRGADGRVQMLLHLDPEGVAELLKAARFGQLANYIDEAARVA